MLWTKILHLKNAPSLTVKPFYPLAMNTSNVTHAEHLNEAFQKGITSSDKASAATVKKKYQQGRNALERIP